MALGGFGDADHGNPLILSKQLGINHTSPGLPLPRASLLNVRQEGSQRSWGKCPADGPNFHRLYATSHQGSGNGFGRGAGRHHIIQQSHMPVVVFVEYEGITRFLAGWRSVDSVAAWLYTV